MSFFTKSTGEQIGATTKFENSGLQPVIPVGTQLQCAIVSAKWAPADTRNNEHILIMLHVVQAGQYRNFTVPHKLQVLDSSAAKADKALEMLAAYDTNIKGMLLAADAAGKKIDDTLLSRALVGGEIVATFDVWEIEASDGSMRSGNWVRAIGPKSKKEQEKDKIIEQKAETLTPDLVDFDDNIPF